ncbi:MAG TPA: hypothetical protein VGC99_13465 [Candidatus Tectomicrobia bacterium]
MITRPFEVPVEFQFLPRGYAISEVSRDTITVIFSGRNQDFSMLEPEALRVVIRIEQSMISHPSSLSVVKFTPRYLEFTVQKQS